MQGKWITYPGKSKEKNLYFRALKEFELESAPEQCRLHIAAESYYKLWINGREAGKGPARGNRSVNFFDTYEASSFLKTGINQIMVLVQSMNIPNFTTYPAGAALRLELENITVTDSDWKVMHNEEWKQDVDMFCVQTGFAEYRDLRITSGQWIEPEIIENMNGKKLLSRPIRILHTNKHFPAEIAHTALIAPWDNASPAADTISSLEHFDKNGKLSADCLPLLHGKDIVIEPPDNGHGISIILNFRREIIGFFELELSAKAGTVIDIAYDEELEDGRLNASRHQYRMADRYICRNGKQTVGTTLHERGFRYVEVAIRNIDGPLTIHRIAAADRRYPLPRTGAFNCNDAMLNRIWDVCVETMSACTTDVFNDCPWRERAFWVNDLIVENIVSLQAFGDYQLNNHALRLAMSNKRDDGMVPGVCPDDDTNSTLVLVPTNLFLLLMLEDYFMYSGDRSLVDRLLPEMLDILEIIASWMDDNHLISPPEKYWNFFDWSFELNDYRLDGRKTSLLNWLYIMALNTTSRLLDYSGDHERAEIYRSKTPGIAAGIEQKFPGSDRKIYCDWLEPDGTPGNHYSQLAQAFALLSDASPETRRTDLKKALEDDSILMPELYLHYFVLKAMCENKIYQPALDRIRACWGPMIMTGTPTLWEAAIHQKGKKAFWNAGSLCHGFGASPITYFQTAILGVTPLEPGFRKFNADPKPHDLEFASGNIPTPNGTIKIAWKRKSNIGIEVELSVPFGLTAVTPAGEFTSGSHTFTIQSGSDNHA